MRAGRLDRRITIDRETELVDVYGTVTRRWLTVATVWAERVQAGTDEFLTSYGESSTTVAVFRIRWRDGIEMTDRIVFDGVPYNIVELKEIGRRAGLEIRCEARR